MTTVIKTDLRYFDESVQRVIESHSQAQMRIEIHKAISEEREACAKFFDDNDTNIFWGSQAAEHIRARGKT